MRRSSYSASAFTRAASPSLRAKEGSSCRRAIACANADASRTGTISPLMPSVTTSRQPGTSVVTRGRAQAAASMRLFGSPSR